MRDLGPRFMGILESVDGILNDVSVNGSDGFSLSEYEEVVRLESVLREFVGRVRRGGVRRQPQQRPRGMRPFARTPATRRLQGGMTMDQSDMLETAEYTPDPDGTPQARYHAKAPFEARPDRFMAGTMDMRAFGPYSFQMPINVAIFMSEGTEVTLKAPIFGINARGSTWDEAMAAFGAALDACWTRAYADDCSVLNDPEDWELFRAVVGWNAMPEGKLFGSFPETKRTYHPGKRVWRYQ